MMKKTCHLDYKIFFACGGHPHREHPSENVDETFENISLFRKMEKPPKVRMYPTSPPPNRFLTPVHHDHVCYILFMNVCATT